MWQSFLKDNNDFTLWSTEHFIWLTIGVLSGVFWIRLGLRQPTEARKTRVGVWMSLIPVAAWLYFLAVILYVGAWEHKNVVPLHLCYFLNFLMPLMLARRIFWLYELTFFWIMAACIQALITPDLTTAFPAWFAFKYWPVHIGLVLSALYATIVYGFRPRYVGIWLSLLAGNIYLACVHPVNLWLETNFMYSCAKPPGSVLDLFGEHYLLCAEPAALFLFHIVWLPFFFMKRREARELSLN